MRSTIVKPPLVIKGAHVAALSPGPELHLWRSGGLGDIIFMEPAIRKLRAMYPNRKIILHAPGHYTAIGELVGFDAVVDNRTNRRDGHGVDLHWAIERHPGAYCLDRVSIWEDVLGVEIGDEAVVIDPPRDRAALEALPGFDDSKPALAFLPFTSSHGLTGRSMPVSHVNHLAKILSGTYNVVMLEQQASQPAGLELDAVCSKVSCTMDDFISLVASCDVALSNDSGGLYVAGASGVPSVGLFEHVAPWLRTKRFDHISTIYLRRPECGCHQHGVCTVPRDGEAPCKFVDADAIEQSLRNARAGDAFDPYDDRGCYSIHRRDFVYQPMVEVSITGSVGRRQTEFCVKRALAGIPWEFAYDAWCGATFRWDLQAGETPSRDDTLYTLNALQMPNQVGIIPRVNIKIVNPGNSVHITQ